MKIIHILPSFYGGGGERFVVEFVNELTKTSHEVHLITMFDINEEMFLAKLLSKNVKHHSLGKKGGIDVSIFYKLFKLLHKIKPDIVNSHLRVFEYLMPSMIFIRKIKFFHTVHSNVYLECASSLLRKIRYVFYRLKLVKPITISEISHASFIEYYKLNNAKMIYNGRSKIIPSPLYDEVKSKIETIKKSPKTKVFLNVANISKTKNHTMLIDAFNKLIQNGHDVLLLIAGDFRKEHKALYDTLMPKCNDNIRFLGLVSNVEDYFYCSDYFVMSSLIEGMPISIIEACSIGLLPISTPAGGVVNMITNEENGWLSNNFTVEDFYNTMCMALTTSNEKLITMKANALKDYENNFTISICVKNYLNAYLN